MKKFIFILILTLNLNHCSTMDAVNIGAAVIGNIEDTSDN